MELRRLLTVCRALSAWNDAEALLHGDWADRTIVREAMNRFAQAPNLLPENPEGAFWFACALVNAGHVAAALPYFARVYAAQPVWRELTPAAGRRGAAAQTTRRCYGRWLMADER